MFVEARNLGGGDILETRDWKGGLALGRGRSPDAAREKGLSSRPVTRSMPRLSEAARDQIHPGRGASAVAYRVDSPNTALRSLRDRGKWRGA